MVAKPTYKELEKEVERLSLELQSAKRQANEHQEAERYYHAFFEHGTDGIVVLDPETTQPLDFNNQVCRQLGYTREEFARLKLHEIEAVEDVDAIKAHICKVLEKGFASFETLHLTKSGKMRNVHVIAKVIAIGDRQVYHCIWQDITEQKKAEEALRRFEILVTQSRDIILFIRMDNGHILDVNESAIKAYGYTREELLSSTIIKLRAPETVDLIPDQMARADSEGILIETVHRRKDGSTFPVELNSRGVSINGIRVLISVIRDITERKKAEKRILESRKKLETALASMTDAVFICDTLDNFVDFNKAFASFHRFENKEACPKKRDGFTDIIEFFIGDDDKPLPREMWPISRALGGERVSNAEYTIHRKDIDETWVGSYSFNPIRDKSGSITGAVVVARDITELKRNEETRYRLEMQLQQAQKLESVGLLAGGVAHDFNNLLTPILGYTDILTLGFEGDDNRLVQLQQIREAAVRAKEVTQRLLAFSRKQLLELKPVDLGDIIHKFENMLRRMIRENIDIEINISPDLGLIKADAGQIEQVLLNLSINAQDSMPEGGTLVIEAKEIFIDESYAAANPEISPGPYALLAVSDTGSGIDEDIVEHIFEPFFTTKEVGKGTGLGLSTIYGIVKQHEGWVSVYSEKNQGSTFKVFLPRAFKGDEKIEEAQQPPIKISHGQETVLVVEDNAIVRKITCDMLEGLGYKVLVADGPEHCIELTAKHQGPIHLLLSDVIMPKMNGKDLYLALNNLRPGIKVIFMSGYAANIISKQRLIDSDVSFIQKPFTLHALSEVIRCALDQ